MRGADSPDVVIVGAGLAGLAAALELDGEDFVVLEASSRVGGRLKSESRGEYWLNFGAHVFGGPDSYVGKLIDLAGLDALPARGPVTALAFKGRLLTNGRPETYPFLLPLSARDRLALIRLGLRIRREGKAYLRAVERRDGEDAWPAIRRGQLFLNDESFARFLGPLSPDLESIFRTISNRAGAQPEEVSAGHGVAAFAMTLTKRPVLGRTIVGGSSLLPEALAERVGDRIMLDTRVRAVRATAAGVEVEYEQSGEQRTMHARAAIVATPSYVAAEILESIAETTRAALRSIKYGPSVLMSILTSESGPMPWDDLYAVTVPGRAFNMFFNIAHVLRQPDVERRPGGSLMIYGTGDPGRRLMDTPDAEVRDLFLRDLYELLPDTRGIVEETVIQRWPAAAPYTFPGRGALQDALERPLDSIFLAGDYLGPSFTETAVMTGQEAAAKARAAVVAEVRR